MELQTALVLAGRNALAKQEERSEIDQLFDENRGDTSMAFDFKPARLVLSAGGAKSFQNTDGDLVPAPLRGIVIDAVKTRGFWPNKDGNKVPFCSSLGVIHGVVNAAYTEEDFRFAAMAIEPHLAVVDSENGRALRDAYSCAQCPMARFGSAYQGGGDSSGQACKLKNLMLFFPEGWHQPCLLSVPTMSVKPWNEYASGVQQRTGRPFFGFMTEIGIEKKESTSGKPYGTLTFKNQGAIEDVERLRAVFALREGLKHYLFNREVVIFRDEDYVDVSGRVVDPETGEVLEPVATP